MMFWARVTPDERNYSVMMATMGDSWNLITPLDVFWLQSRMITFSYAHGRFIKLYELLMKNICHFEGLWQIHSLMTFYKYRPCCPPPRGTVWFLSTQSFPWWAELLPLPPPLPSFFHLHYYLYLSNLTVIAVIFLHQKSYVQYVQQEF